MNVPEPLIAWLREQIEKDKRIASAAAHLRPEWGEVADDNPWGIDDHVDEWSPDRVLAECDAKLRLLQQFDLRGRSVRAVVRPETGGVWDDLLRMLALPYAARPGYCEEWRP